MWSRNMRGSRRGARLVAVVLFLAATCLGGTSDAQTLDEDLCASYPTFTALGGAAGLHTVTAWPGITVFDVDGALPGAQAEFSSPGRSAAWAGAPYSTSLGIAGQAGIDPTQAPIFAVSAHPSKPETRSSTAGIDVHAWSDAWLSSSEAVVGTPPTDVAPSGQVSASASASCDQEGTVRATAHTEVSALDIGGGVLHIGSVRSHAEASIDREGKQSLNGTMEIDGATILGQRVTISDQGLVALGSVTPFLNDPLSKALSTALTDAGIGIRYIAADKDPKAGTVRAAGLEITVTAAIDSLGTGAPLRSTVTVGRAYAIAVTTPGFDDPPALVEDPGLGAPSVATGSNPGLASPPGAAPARKTIASPELSVASTRLDDISWGSSYGIGVAALVLLVVVVQFKRGGVRLRWR